MWIRECSCVSQSADNCADPSDLVVYNALRTLQQHAGRDQGLRTSTNFYDLAGGVSGGTIASVGAVGDSGEGMNPKFQYALCPSTYTLLTQTNISPRTASRKAKIRTRQAQPRPRLWSAHNRRLLRRRGSQPPCC